LWAFSNNIPGDNYDFLAYFFPGSSGILAVPASFGDL